MDLSESFAPRLRFTFSHLLPSLPLFSDLEQGFSFFSSYHWKLLPVTRVAKRLSTIFLGAPATCECAPGGEELNLPHSCPKVPPPHIISPLIRNSTSSFTPLHRCHLEPINPSSLTLETSSYAYDDRTQISSSAFLFFPIDFKIAQVVDRCLTPDLVTGLSSSNAKVPSKYSPSFQNQPLTSSH